MQTLETRHQATPLARVRPSRARVSLSAESGRADTGSPRRSTCRAGRPEVGVVAARQDAAPEPDIETPEPAIEAEAALREEPDREVCLSEVDSAEPLDVTAPLREPGPRRAPYLPSCSQYQVDGLQLYLREASRSTLLTAEEEVRLAQEMEAGREARARLESGDVAAEEVSALVAARERGEAARQRLIAANLRLVVSLARQHVGPDVDFADLIQEGNIGLMRAVDRFDWRKGNRFSTYALWWIRQAVSSAISEHSRSIRLPSHMIDSLSRLSKTEQRLTQELGRTPTDHEVCHALGISIGKLADLRQAMDRPCSLEAPVGEGGDSELVDLVEDRVAPTPLSALLAASLRDQVERVLATLDARERTVISLRFGLGDDQARTLEEVGRHLNITKERVRQIETRALRKLRHSTRIRWLAEYADEV